MRRWEQQASREPSDRKGLAITGAVEIATATGVGADAADAAREAAAAMAEAADIAGAEAVDASGGR